ncbi:hypothetical protein ASG88_14160 [Nocardioides sp. Soil777]|uniref:hypothetical protein n=1 Tax=Nocardioides sp. Soil777 TaxID=1736409 RepID=UPI00070384B0|nr:hypothetical protein [Nocardioides sp. Soil777]KRE99740.1 hypothetical protein ASG88_14160 [Nocardioides sp. Soil777]
METSPLLERTVRPSGRGVLRLAVVGGVAQAMGAWWAWTVVDDYPGAAWYTSDFLDWCLLGAGLVVLLAGLAGAVTRRWRVASSVAAGCVLAMLVGCAVLIGSAIMHSA